MQLRFGIALYAGLVAMCAVSAGAQEKPADTNPSSSMASGKVKVYIPGNDVTAPEPIPRDYSSMLVSSCERTQSVKTELKLIVDATGSPKDVTADDSGDPSVALLLFQWMKTVRFKPALWNGNPVAAGISDHIQVVVCYAKESDAEGKTITRLHLYSAPIEKFSPWKDAPAELPIYMTRESSQSDEKTEHIGKSVTPPVAVYTVNPKYSDEARSKNVQGTCLLQIIVDAKGITQNPRIVKPIGYGLDEMAIDAVKQYRFKPATKDGKPVPVYMTIAINFRLR
jgi:TonB family protein